MCIMPYHCSLGCLIQAGNANYLQKALSNQTSNFQIIKEEEGQIRVENVVQLGPLLAIKAGGTCAPEGASRTMVTLDDIRAELGPLRSANNVKACSQCRAQFASSDVPCELLHWIDSRQLLSQPCPMLLQKHGMVHTSPSPHSNGVRMWMNTFQSRDLLPNKAALWQVVMRQHCCSINLPWSSGVHRKSAIALVACHENCSLCRIPLPKGNSSSSSQPAYVDWLYLDDDLRITRGSKGSTFIHTKS